MGLCNRYCRVGRAGGDRVVRAGREEGVALAQPGFRVAVEDADTAVLCSDASPPVPVKWP